MSYVSQDHNGIPNKKIYKKLAKALNRGFLSSGKIDEEQVKAVTELHLNEDEISDLEFLRFFPNLEDFGVASAKLTNIAGLRFVPKISNLSISNHSLSDISDLCYCPGLIFLEIETYMGKTVKPFAIQDFSVIGSLTELDVISLENNNIHDISWIASLKKLKYASLLHNPIEDFSPLLELPSLQKMEVSFDKKAALGDAFSHIELLWEE